MKSCKLRHCIDNKIYMTSKQDDRVKEIETRLFVHYGVMNCNFKLHYNFLYNIKSAPLIQSRKIYNGPLEKVGVKSCFDID